MSGKKFGGITVNGVPQKQKKHLGAQIAMALLVGFLFFGALFVRFLHWGHHLSIAEIGAFVAVDVLLLIGIAVWAIRTWDY